MLKKKALKITDEQRKKCNAIIHTHSTMCAGVGTGLAQIPLADNAVITPIQVAMIIELGLVFDQKISKTIAQSIISSTSASVIGRGVTQVLFGFIPGIGNAINTATAAGLTEAIGWMAVKNFSEGKLGETCLSDDSEGTAAESMSEESKSAEEQERSLLVDEANMFLDGSKTRKENEADYKELLRRFEQKIRNCSREDELNMIYGKLCDVPSE